MVKCFAGSFTMGSPEDELGHDKYEIQHEVTLSKDFYIGKYEVTQALYETVMGNNPSKHTGSDNPVDNVTWNNAKEFCFELNRLTEATRPEGYRFDLPTEAQWEYACRAGSTTSVNSGKNITEKYDNCDNLDQVCWNKGNSEEKSHPVGQKAPNAWGLYDMHGNVSEWCRDWYGDYTKDSVTDPVGPKMGDNRSIRGGSWKNHSQDCRSARRDYAYENKKYDFYGFRLALVPYTKPEVKKSDKEELTFNVKDVEFTVMPIPAGTFTMGSPEDEMGRDKHEIQHEVTISKDFYIGKYEVTQALYEAVMGNNPSNFKDDNSGNYPVENVNWNNAKIFCYELNQIASSAIPAGYRFDLPTEAQWEYACRAGTTTSLNNGENITEKLNCCAYCYEVGWPKSYSEERTHPVGQKAPNAWGLYDMHGNVSEWCRDWLVDDYTTEKSTDPVGPKYGSFRVIRGGGWINYNSDCRSAKRDSAYQDSKRKYIGFRLALVPYVKPEAKKPEKDALIFKVKDVEFTVMPIPAGTFIMGSPENEWGLGKYEIQHEVTLSKDFYMGKYEVTQALYEAVMGKNPSCFKNDNSANYPVENVSWNDANNFCDKLNNLTASNRPKGFEFSLPTEAQWEYACRAGTTTDLNNGEYITETYKPCVHSYEVAWTKAYSDDKTHPVGLKSPNAWGLYDMHGNVCEWCLDVENDYTADSCVDPVKTGNSSRHVYRGGGWQSYVLNSRSAYRNFTYGEDKDLGFRVVLTAK